MRIRYSCVHIMPPNQKILETSRAREKLLRERELENENELS